MRFQDVLVSIMN